MKMTPIKSYSSLDKVINFHFYWLKRNDQNYSSKIIKFLKEDMTIITLSLIWLNKKMRDVSQFQSNRYFLDTLNINSLPSPNELNSFLKDNQLKDLFYLSKKNLDFDNYGNLKIIGLDILKKFYKHTSIINASKKQWGDDKKNFYNKNGYVVIPDVMTSSECDNYRKLILNIAHDEKINGEGYFYGFNNKFQRIYNLINKSQKLGELLTLPIVSLIMNDLFDRDTLHDKYVLSSWHANIVPPEGKEQKFHLDAAVPNPIPPWIIRANINFIVEDHNEENGATVCLPGSHKFLRKPTKSDEKKYENKFKKMIAPKGSMIIWSGHLWHKSGANNTTTERAALLACFAASHLIEMALEENHPLIIDRNNLEYFSEDLKKLLLFDHGIKQGAMIKSKYFKK